MNNLILITQNQTKLKQENNMTIKIKTVLIVSAGQYEQTAIKVTVRHATHAGLIRRARQLAQAYPIFSGGDCIGWLKARVAIASDNDVWGKNSFIGGRYCEPANGWMNI
jgi:exosortase/archaeosortase